MMENLLVIPMLIGLVIMMIVTLHLALYSQSNGAVSLYSKKQPVVALSTAETEYIL